MFCSEIIHFLIVEHLGSFKFFAPRNISVLDMLYICLLEYFGLLSLDWFLLSLDFNFQIDFFKKHWAQVCKHFYDFC